MQKKKNEKKKNQVSLPESTETKFEDSSLFKYRTSSKLSFNVQPN